MKDYESIIVFKPDLEAEAFEQSLGKVEKFIKKQGGKTTDLEKWGLRDLAYEIQKYKQGNYVQLRFQCEPEAVVVIERHYKLADPIIRFVTVNLRPDQVKAMAQAEKLSQEEEE